MRAWRLTLLPLAVAAGVLLGFRNAEAQQTGTVTGVVTDSTSGAPLIGAQMVVAGTNIGGLTDQNGRYLLTRVPAGDRQIRAVLIGYSQMTLPVTVVAGGSATLDFKLATTAIQLEAVVVSAATGREQRARELGTKVANIDTKNVNPATVSSVADVLEGKAEGVVMQDVNGTTGTSQRIRIRGANSLSLSNDPLIYLDGVQINTSYSGFGVGGQEASRLNDINPNDIENVEIVKGPAASALYGTSAANGVILITTKRGRPGTTQWNAWVEGGRIKDITDYPDNWLTYQINDASQPMFRASDNRFNSSAYPYCSNISAANGTCTQDGTLTFNTLKDPRTTPYSTGYNNRYGMSVRGGTEQVRFFVSGQLSDEKGVVKFNTQKQTNFRGNLDAQLSSNADLSLSLGYTGARLGLNNNDNSIFSPMINGLLGQAYFIPPNPDTPNLPNGANYGFGYSVEELNALVVDNDADHYNSAVNMKWRPTSWFTVNANGGLDFTDEHDHRTLQPHMLPIAVSYTNGFRASQRTNTYIYQALVSGVANFQLRDNLLSTTTVGGSYTKNNRTDTYCYGSSLVPGTASCGTTSSLYSINEGFFEVKTVGAYVQQELAWRDKVFAAASIRGDDNSNFGSGVNLVYYPAASLSWVIGEESWFPRPSWMSNLRLRSAYGTSGQQPGFRNAVTLYNPTTVAVSTGDVPGVSLSSTGNDLLKPERTTEYELGFDTGFLQDRIGIDFTYFNKTSHDALISRRLPPSLGLTTSVFQNLGSIANQGTELTARLSVLQKKNIGLDINFTNSTLSNKVKALGQDVEPIIINRGLQRYEEGYSAGSFFQIPYTYNDANGDGKLSIDEVKLVGDPAAGTDTAVYIGPSMPKWDRTISANLRLFDWLTVTTLFEGRGGHYTGNDTESFRCGYRSSYGCDAVADPNASLETQARFIADRYLGSAYGYVEKANFYKWRDFSVTVQVPRSISSRFSQLHGVRLTFAGRNLATWTNYTGLDPETVEGGGNANFSQSEFNTQPPARYFLLRLDYSF